MFLSSHEASLSLAPKYCQFNKWGRLSACGTQVHPHWAHTAGKIPVLQPHWKEICIQIQANHMGLFKHNNKILKVWALGKLGPPPETQWLNGLHDWGLLQSLRMGPRSGVITNTVKVAPTAFLRSSRDAPQEPEWLRKLMELCYRCALSIFQLLVRDGLFTCSVLLVIWWIGQIMLPCCVLCLLGFGWKNKFSDFSSFYRSRN